MRPLSLHTLMFGPSKTAGSHLCCLVGCCLGPDADLVLLSTHIHDDAADLITLCELLAYARQQLQQMSRPCQESDARQEAGLYIGTLLSKTRAAVHDNSMALTGECTKLVPYTAPTHKAAS